MGLMDEIRRLARPYEDEEMEDAVTSNPGMILIILSLFTRSFYWSVEFLAIDSFCSSSPCH